MTASPHDPRGNGNNESNGSDGDKCLQHNSNSCTYTLLESIATDHNAQDRNKDDQQEFNHECIGLANDEG